MICVKFTINNVHRYVIVSIVINASYVITLLAKKIILVIKYPHSKNIKQD
jgi:hypothetical protein